MFVSLLFGLTVYIITKCINKKIWSHLQHFEGHSLIVGWQFFMSLNQLSYPTLVRKFYCNLECGHNLVSLTSFVRGVKISLILGLK